MSNIFAALTECPLWCMSRLPTGALKGVEARLSFPRGVPEIWRPLNSDKLTITLKSDRCKVTLLSYLLTILYSVNIRVCIASSVPLVVHYFACSSFTASQWNGVKSLTRFHPFTRESVHSTSHDFLVCPKVKDSPLTPLRLK